MTSAAHIIAALGGTSAVARELDVPASTVSSWKSGGSIPRWRMAGITSLAKSLGVDLDVVGATDNAPASAVSSRKSGDLTAAQQSEAA